MPASLAIESPANRQKMTTRKNSLITRSVAIGTSSPDCEAR